MHDFELKFFRLVRFWINFSTTRQIWIEKFTMRKILNRNNLPKSTTCTFHIAFLHITMYSYKPQYLLPLDYSSRHRSNNVFVLFFARTFTFDFAIVFDFWICLIYAKTSCCWKQSCNNYYSFHLTHVWLVVKKGYDKIKHVN